jgi:phospholipase/lecithinase/hemolysin
MVGGARAKAINFLDIHRNYINFIDFNVLARQLLSAPANHGFHNNFSKGATP